MGNPGGEDGSPISVVSALKLTRKGRLSYDRHWGKREASVERVLKEVTGGLGTLGLYKEEVQDGKEEEEEEANETESGECEEEVPPQTPSFSLTVTQDGANSPPSSLPHMITLPLLRDCEREVMVRKAVLDEEEGDPNFSLLDCSHNDSQVTASNDTSVLETSLFCYSTPEMLRVVSSRRSPRVLLPKIKIPEFLLTEDGHDPEDEEADSSDKSVNEVEEHLVSVQSPVEEELLVYEERRREEALKRQQERKKRWEEEAERRKGEEEEMAERREGELERRLSEG